MLSPSDLPFRSVAILLLLVFCDVCGASKVLEARATSTPSPLAITPSQNWDGNDGPWSSFPISIGSPPQLLKLLIATSSSQTWAVATEGCTSGDPQSCKQDRGGLWDRTTSRSYSTNTANITSDIYSLDLEDSLGYVGRGRYGFDNVQLGWNPSNAEANNQTVVGIATKDYFLGLFGIKPQSTTFIGDPKTVPSFIESLKNNSVIPSLSWGYTAGNQYRSSNGYFGSLTLGGYDSSKFTPNNVPFNMSEGERDLVVDIQKITTSDGKTTLLPNAINASLDSAVPFIYLPAEACELFVKEFQLSWNATSKLYIVSDTTHTLLLAKNPSITFNIGTATQNVNITLPYAAFDQQATYPYTADVNTKVRYFPLRPVDNSSNYTLGRTFFQEAYVIADYERGNFSVSQALFNGRTDASLVAIYPVGGAPKKGTPVAAIAGGVAGGVAIILLVLLYFFWWKPRQRKRNTAELDSSSINPLYHPLHPNSHQKDSSYVKAELDAGDDHLALQARDGRFGKPVEVSGQQEIYEMDGGEVVHEVQGASRDEKRGSWLWGKDRKRESGVPSRQDTTDTFGFPRTPHSAHPGESGESSIQNTPAVNYAVPSPRRHNDGPPISYRDPYRDRTPSPRGEYNRGGPTRNYSMTDSIAISSPGNSLRVPPRSPGRSPGTEETPIVSPASATDGRQFGHF